MPEEISSYAHVVKEGRSVSQAASSYTSTDIVLDLMDLIGPIGDPAFSSQTPLVAFGG